MLILGLSVACITPWSHLVVHDRKSDLKQDLVSMRFKLRCSGTDVQVTAIVDPNLDLAEYRLKQQLKMSPESAKWQGVALFPSHTAMLASKVSCRCSLTSSRHDIAYVHLLSRSQVNSTNDVGNK